MRHARVHAVALAGLLLVEPLAAYLGHPALKLCEHGHLLQEAHLGRYAPLLVDERVDRVVVPPHGLEGLDPLEYRFQVHLGRAHARGLLHVGADAYAVRGEHALGHGAGGDEGGRVAAAEEARAYRVVPLAVLLVAGVGGVAGAGGAVGALVLVYVLEVAVEVGDEDHQRRAVGVALVLEARHGVSRVHPAVDDGDVHLPPRRGKLPLAGLAEELVAVNLLLRYEQAGRDPLEAHAQALLVRASGHRHAEHRAVCASEHLPGASALARPG